MENHLDVTAERLADLLGTWVSIVDEYGIEVARASAPGDRNGSLATDRSPFLSAQVPIRNGIIRVHTGEPRVSRLSNRAVVESTIALAVRHAFTGPLDQEETLARQSLIAGMLTGEHAGEKRLVRDARRLGIDLDRPRCVMLLEASDEAGSLEDGRSRRYAAWRSDLVQYAIQSFFGKPDDFICGAASQGQYVVLASSDADAVWPWVKNGDMKRYGENWVNFQVAKDQAHALLHYLSSDLGMAYRVSVGRQYQGLSRLPLSYADAEIAMRAGCSLPDVDPDMIFSLDDLAPDVVIWLTDSRMKAAFSKRLLAPLEEDPELWKTLKVFFEENCGPALTSKRLNIHRNSLYYRLDKIAGLVGLDPHKIEDAAVISMALRIRGRSGDGLDQGRLFPSTQESALPYLLDSSPVQSIPVGQ